MKSARMVPVLVTVVAAGGLLAWAAVGGPPEQKLSASDLPSAGRTALERHAHGATIREIERDTDHGRTVYEVEVVIAGRQVELKFDENGNLLGRQGGREQHAQQQEHGRQPEAHEREVTAAQVPPAALAALKKLAGEAKITAFAEEVEHGHTFYEGSWRNSAGHNVDGLVTPTGDLVEIEEVVGRSEVPAAVLAVARKLAGKDARPGFEKKTLVLYEVKFRSAGRFHEMLLTPDGRSAGKEAREAPGDEEHERGRHEQGDD